MRRVLIVAYYFPPIGGIGSIRAASFARFLPEFGWEATVLAPAETPHPRDPSLDAGGAAVVRTRSLEPSRLGRLRRHDQDAGAAVVSGAPAVRSPASLRLRGAAKRLLFPDTQVGWYPGAVAGGRRLLRKERFDAVFSTAFPITSHLVAWTLKGRSPLPWVAEFRDPWSDDPEFRSVAAAALRVERAIARAADAVVLPNRTFAEYYAGRWGVEAAVIGHGSDAAIPGPAPRPDPPVLAHVGSYIPGRQRLDTVWRALAELRRRGSSVPRLRWVGPFPEHARAELERHDLLDLLDVTGPVSQSAALAAMAEATGLIAGGFVETGPLSLGTTPAKLLEYLASGVPIVYVGHPQGEAARMLDRHAGCHTVAFDDVEGAIDAVESAMRGEVHRRDTASLSRRARTAELAALFDSIVDRTGAG